MNENVDILKELREGKPKKRVRAKKENKMEWQLQFVTLFIVFGLLFTGAAYAFERYANWRAGHEYQFPVKWLGITKVKESAIVSAVETKPKTEAEIMEQYHLAPVLKTVYFLESTSGKKDGCKDEGKVNGYGYGQNKSGWKCYNSFEQVTERVNEWFEDRLAVNGNDLIEAVCYYNTGHEGQLSCGDYSANFFSVLTKNF